MMDYKINEEDLLVSFRPSEPKQTNNPPNRPLQHQPPALNHPQPPALNHPQPPALNHPQPVQHHPIMNHVHQYPPP